MNIVETYTKEARVASAPLPPWKNDALAWLGGVLAIAAIAQVGHWMSLSLILGSFGASCVLVFGFPDLPFSQPRNVVVGHFLSSLIGLLFLTLFGTQWWALALAVGTTIAAMMLTRTVHPPAGSNPVIIFLTQPSWSFLWFPTLTGALLLVLVALLYNNVARPKGSSRYDYTANAFVIQTHVRNRRKVTTSGAIKEKEND